jgi:hypothetical protein
MPRRAAPSEDAIIEAEKQLEMAVVEEFSFVPFISTEPEPIGFNFGPYYAGRVEPGSKHLLWRVPPEDVENMKKHFFFTSGRVKLLES